MRLIAALLAAAAMLVLAACGPSPSAEPRQATPALWAVTGPDGAHGFLFGTIHALPGSVIWRSPKLEAALAGSDTLAVELAAVTDPSAMRARFIDLSHATGLPPLRRRVPAGDRPALAKMLDRTGYADDDFAAVETWAAALMLARAMERNDSANGVDAALMAKRGKLRVVELEGLDRQLAVFDTLPETDQRDLLRAVVRDAGPAHERRVADAWMRGDMDILANETRTGILADPELREALLVARNRDWADRIDRLIRGGARPFVAVGAGHMAGPDGLPALLRARGWTVTRRQ